MLRAQIKQFKKKTQENRSKKMEEAAGDVAQMWPSARA